jgi:hypothetical protein
VVCAPIDEKISSQGTTWYNDTEISSSFSNDLTRWHSYNIVRTVGGFVGWILVTIDNNYSTHVAVK